MVGNGEVEGFHDGKFSFDDMFLLYSFACDFVDGLRVVDRGIFYFGNNTDDCSCIEFNFLLGGYFEEILGKQPSDDIDCHIKSIFGEAKVGRALHHPIVNSYILDKILSILEDSL